MKEFYWDEVIVKYIAFAIIVSLFVGGLLTI